MLRRKLNWGQRFLDVMSDPAGHFGRGFEPRGCSRRTRWLSRSAAIRLKASMSRWTSSPRTAHREGLELSASQTTCGTGQAADRCRKPFGPPVPERSRRKHNQERHQQEAAVQLIHLAIDLPLPLCKRRGLRLLARPCPV